MTIVWLNGALCDSAEARIDPSDRGFTLGDGLFETMAVRGGKIPRLESHLRRLSRGCEVLGLPPAPDTLSDVIGAVLAANELQDAAVRITYTRGLGARGLAAPVPCRRMLLSRRALCRRPAACEMHRGNGHAAQRILAALAHQIHELSRRHSRAGRSPPPQCGRGAPAEYRREPAEATAANLFIVRGGQVMTPPLGDGALEGTMRSEIIAQTGAAECSLPVADLLSADEAFLSNSLGLQAVASVDGTPIGEGAAVLCTGRCCLC